jgi:hypothetical protein
LLGLLVVFAPNEGHDLGALFSGPNVGHRSQLAEADLLQ